MLITPPHNIELTSSFRVNSKNDCSDSNSTHFKRALYRNSKVQRIILGEDVRESNLDLDTWYTVNLKLVTELGLPVNIPSSSACQLPVACQLLEWKEQGSNGGYYSIPSDLNIQYRLYEEQDTWKLQDKVDDAFSFACDISLQYKIYLMLQEIWDNGTPGKLWDSALVMNYVLNELFQIDNNYLSGLTLMDLSAGVGCLGLSIAKNCHSYQVTNPPEIVLTDLEVALPLIRKNQQLNRIPDSRHISIERLEWGSTKDINLIVKKRTFQYILVSDVLYNIRDFPILISTFCQLLNKNKEAIILMGYKPRGLNQHEENLFFDTCGRLLDIETLDIKTFSQQFFRNQMVFPLQNSRILDSTGVRLYKITQKKDIYSTIY
ncbi:MAG: putative methyltransferase-domain-containing protein [Benjaminiella poitrasii]|nr:MAG: putative methyltransferase-domain-containing protein [Benjaminiella poitrasii]